MSDELSKLQRQLEQATAAECPPDAPLDAETASLREGWLALGQLLEAAQPALDEPLELPQLPRRRAPARWKLVGIAVLAASLLVGATLAWSLMRARQPGGLSPPPDELASPNVKQDELHWDDSLDEEIALAGQQLVRIQQDWYYLDDPFGPVQHGLEQVAEDIEDDTL